MDKLEQIILTLERVEVHGSENMSRLLGCIQELQKIQIETRLAKKEAEHGNPEKTEP